MKKYLLILLALITVLTLVACGSKPANKPNDSNPTVSDPTNETPKDPTAEKPGVTLGSDTMTVYMKEPVKLDYTVTGSETPVFKTTNPNIVTVSEDGTITGVTPGKAAVSVKVGNIEKACIITVETYAPAAAGKTEEELGILPLGTYTISLADANKTPVTYNVDPSTLKESSNAAQTISLSTGGEYTEFTIVYQTIGDDPYYIIWMKDQNLYNLAPTTTGSISAGREILMYYKKQSPALLPIITIWQTAINGICVKTQTEPTPSTPI